MSEEVFAILLSSIAARRLVVVTGAGLSIPAPSNLPSARALALECASRHLLNTGEEFSEAIQGDIEAQARLFLGRHQLQSYFLEKLVDWRPFQGTPNLGHYAVADFLGCGAADFSITANVDALVEIASRSLGDPTFYSAVRGAEAATPREHSPLLKIHGCVRRGVQDTLWCRDQLAEEEWQERIEETTQWLAGNLTQRDLIFVGYWTDWDYLNDVLIRVLKHGLPRSVTLVDPATESVLKEKAAGLWDWAHRAGISFHHVQQSGSDFLEQLRHRFGTQLLRQIVEDGKRAYELSNGGGSPAFPTLSHVSAAEIYDVRRDWEGVRRDDVTRRLAPRPSDELLGKMFFELLAAGAVPSGSELLLKGKRIRLFQAAGRMLYSVKDQLTGEFGPSDAPDITLCVGASPDGGVPADIVRPDRTSTIIRPGIAGQWYTDQDIAIVIEN